MDAAYLSSLREENTRGERQCKHLSWCGASAGASEPVSRFPVGELESWSVCSWDIVGDELVVLWVVWRVDGEDEDVWESMCWLLYWAPGTVWELKEEWVGTGAIEFSDTHKLDEAVGPMAGFSWPNSVQTSWWYWSIPEMESPKRHSKYSKSFWLIKGKEGFEKLQSLLNCRSCWFDMC